MRIRPILTAAAGLLLLAGCTAAPAPVEPEPSPEPSSSTPAPEPEPTVVSIDVGADVVTITDSEGAASSYDYLTPGATLVEVFTEVFGSAPTEVPYPGHIEARPGVDYTWEGFVLRVQDFEAIPPTPDDPGATPISYLVTAPTVGDIAVASKGIAASDSGSAVPVCLGSDGEAFAGLDGQTYAWRCVHSVAVDEVDGYELQNFVMARIRVDTGEIVELYALGMNYGV